MAMPSAGDLVVCGIGAPGGDVAFLPERSAHAGPSPIEIHTFILHAPTGTPPEAPLTRPVQRHAPLAADRGGVSA
jgi:hypothetical protein